jgi:hypothetical protein
MVGDKYRPLTKFITMGRGLGLSQIVMGGRGLKNDTDWHTGDPKCSENENLAKIILHVP